ncbi:hypothetical protein DTQ70_27880 [Runella sp. SP2]|nr:hypothetical protein DTQ70_27880 [Runella sp. SP2]
MERNLKASKKSSVSLPISLLSRGIFWLNRPKTISAQTKIFEKFQVASAEAQRLWRFKEFKSSLGRGSTFVEKKQTTEPLPAFKPFTLN